MKKHVHARATADTIHWGYFSKTLKSLVEIASGDFVSIEAITHRAGDDVARMAKRSYF